MVRKRNPRHRRAWLVSPTELAREYLATAAALEVEWLTEVIGAFEPRVVRDVCGLLAIFRDRAGHPAPDFDG